MTKHPVTEVNRIYEDWTILKSCLSNTTVAVITIMISLFDEKQIMKFFPKAEDITQNRTVAEIKF